MPGTVIGSPLSFIGAAWVGASDTAGGATQPLRYVNVSTFAAARLLLTLKPIALPNAPVLRTTSAVRIVSPSALTNTPVVRSASAIRATKPAAFPNASVFQSASAVRNARPAAHTNTPVFPALRLTLKLSPAAYANSSILRAAAVAQPGKLAPHRSSTAQIFAPALVRPVSVTVTLSLPGMIPRAPKPQARRSTASWPNLPKVDTPPWRLTVVTPELARERARQRIAAGRRAEQQRRKRKSNERASDIVNALIDEQVLRAIVDVAAETV